MMKNLKHIWSNTILRLCAMVAALGMISCDADYLNTVPLTNISDATAYDTPERILAQVNGLYSAIKTGGYLGGRYILYNEIRANEYIQTKSNTVTGLNTWNQSVNSSTSEVTGTWSSGYGVINKVNTFLAGMEIFKAKVDPALYTQYVAEAKFLRALSYFSLVKVYARPYTENAGAGLGLPLRLQAESTNANNDLERSSVAAVYAQILKDLNEAEAGVPATHATALLNTTRVHKNTVAAIKARIYLNMGDYDNVIKESLKIVSTAAPFQTLSGVVNKLEATQAAVFAGAYTGPEAMLFFPFSTNDTPGTTNALTYLYTNAPGNGEYYLNPDGTISDPVFAAGSTDTRKNLITTSIGQSWLNKFKSASPYTDYIPLIRYAEVLLNYSEALARTGGANLTKAQDLLMAVRRRSSANYTFAPASIGTQQALISTILTERKIELLGEGFRVPDLQRTLSPLPGKSGNGSTAPTIALAASNYIWPISGDEIGINKLMKPNP